MEIVVLNDSKIFQLVSEAVYEKYLQKSLKFGESSMDNTFHCKTPDCSGWYVSQDFNQS